MLITCDQLKKNFKSTVVFILMRELCGGGLLIFSDVSLEFTTIIICRNQQKEASFSIKIFDKKKRLKYLEEILKMRFSDGVASNEIK